MKKKKKFNIFFNWCQNAGVTFYRMINPAKYMRRIKDVTVGYSEFNPAAQTGSAWQEQLYSNKYREKILKDLEFLMTYSNVSVWQMLHNDMSLSVYLGCRDVFKKKPLLLEIDDDVYHVNPESHASMAYHPGSVSVDVVHRQIQNASGLIVTTDYLKKLYEPLNCSIQIVPNGIDFEVWDNLQSAKSAKIRIGWAGGQAHYKDLKVISRIIPTILKKYKNVEFVFFGLMPDYIEASPRVRHHKKAWVGIDKYPAELASLGIDIGVAPLKDNHFNRAKSNLRWLEYSALKIPTVASPIENYRKTIKDGDTGLLANEESEWIASLSHLIENEKARRIMGLAAYNEVKKRYNIETIARDYTNILKGYVSGEIKSNKKRVFESHAEQMMPTYG